MFKKLTYVLVAVVLCSCGVRNHVGKPVVTGNYPLWSYTEGLKQASIWDNIEDAEEYYRLAILQDSTFDVAYYALAKLTGDVAAARRTVELDSTNLVYRGLLGRVLIANGEYDEALRLYNELVSLEPRNYLNYRMLASLYEYRGLPFSAISVLDSAEMRVGQTDDLIRYRLHLLTGVRQFERAVEDAGQILADEPDDVDALIVMAENYERLADEHNYLATLQRLFAQQDYPFENKRALFEGTTASIDFYRRNYFDINALATTLMLTYPDSREAVDIYARHLLQTGDIEQALGVYKSFLSNRNSTVEDYQMVIDIEGYLQHPDSVSKYAARAITLYPKNAPLYASRGIALLKMERQREAMAEFELAVKYSDSDSLRSGMLALLGDVYHQLGNQKKCFETYRRALKLDPDNALALNNYAYFMCELPDADREQCLKMSSRAVALEPSNSSYLDTRAWILHLLGRDSEAKQVMLRALSLDTTRSATLYIHYADILEALGDTFMADVYRKRAVDASKQ